MDCQFNMRRLQLEAEYDEQGYKNDVSFDETPADTAAQAPPSTPDAASGTIYRLVVVMTVFTLSQQRRWAASRRRALLLRCSRELNCAQFVQTHVVVLFA